LNSRTEFLKPFRVESRSVTDLRSSIIAWSSMVDVKNVAKKKEPGGKKVKEWSLVANLN